MDNAVNTAYIAEKYVHKPHFIFTPDPKISLKGAAYV